MVPRGARAFPLPPGGDLWYGRRQGVSLMTSGSAWLDEALANPVVQLLAFVLTFVLRVEIDRWQRKRDTKRQKKKKGAQPA